MREPKTTDENIVYHGWVDASYRKCRAWMRLGLRTSDYEAEQREYRESMGAVKAFRSVLETLFCSLMELPEFVNLDTLRAFCKQYAQATSEPTEFNMYSETEHFYIWLRLTTRLKDYNIYVNFYMKGSIPDHT